MQETGKQAPGTQASQDRWVLHYKELKTSVWSCFFFFFPHLGYTPFFGFPIFPRGWGGGVGGPHRGNTYFSLCHLCPGLAFPSHRSPRASPGVVNAEPLAWAGGGDSRGASYPQPDFPAPLFFSRQPRQAVECGAQSLEAPVGKAIKKLKKEDGIR